jgi:hypothetical protein
MMIDTIHRKIFRVFKNLRIVEDYKGLENLSHDIETPAQHLLREIFAELQGCRYKEAI